LTKQAKRLADRTAEKAKNGNHAPNEGKNPSSTTSTETEVTRALFGGS
jgi:hypothetical protein